MPGLELTVCQVLTSLQLGGAEVLAAQLARRLSDSYRFMFACLEELGPLGARLREEGFPVQVLGKRPHVDCRTARRLRALIRRESVDLVHAHQYGSFFYTALARFPSHRPAVLLTEHGRFHPDFPRRRHILANRMLLRRHDRLVGVGQTVQRALIENEGFPAGRIEVVHNGIDTSAFASNRIDRKAVRHEIGVTPEDFVILQVARLDPIKDHATALRALAHVVRHRKTIRLILVGAGPGAESIDDAIHRLSLGSHVYRLGSRNDVARLLGAADAALLTSHSEGIPLALIEAMAAGLPVVATRVGGVPEIVEEGQTGLLAPAGDAGALAGHLLRLADDPGLRAQLGDAGRRRAWERFSEDRMIMAYDRMYREVVEQAGGRPWPIAAGERA